MALQATYVGVIPRTVIPTAASGVLGVRVAVNSSGVVAVADHTVRGDFTSLQSWEASVPFNAVSMQGGGRVPALASEAVNAGDAAYSADSGKYSKTSTSAVLCGKWATTTSSGEVGEVELGNPA